MITNLSDIDTPAVLIEKSVMENNVRLMQALSDRCRVNLRVHVKTHKIPALAKLQLKAGAIGIAVAKLGEAEVMAAAGIKDIQIANIIVGESKFRRLARLSRTCRLSIAIDSEENAKELSIVLSRSRRSVNVFIKVDTGLRRCGLAAFPRILQLVERAQKLKGVKIVGLLTHAGHAYGARNRKQVQDIGQAEGEVVVRFARRLTRLGFQIPVVSVGSTPTAPYCAAVDGVTELRVGNYIFNDMTQVALGTVGLNRCALGVLATVISIPTPDRAVIDAGSKALGTDRGAHGRDILAGFGHIVGGGGELTRLSEEHGVIERLTRPFKIGQKVRVIPNHACTVMNLFDSAYLVDGEAVIERNPVAARGRTS
ncbi:MAG TPA: alanine racemase [Candidatus Deferrimicrobium sp.]|nr:alanine racemase [Candidatus Deferrimicrobium sp.]